MKDSPGEDLEIRPFERVDSFVDIVAAHAREHAHDTAVTFVQDDGAEQRLSYAELDLRAQAVGAKLQSLSACGERVLLLYPSGLDFVCAFLGCLYAGAVAVPAPAVRRSARSGRLRSIVQDAKPSVIMSERAIFERVDRFVDPLFDKSYRRLTLEDVDAKDHEAWGEPELDKNALAYLQYTSGSTTRPAGVMISHGNLLHNCETIRVAFEHSPRSVNVGWLPLFHDMGLVGNVLESLYVGFPVILMSPEGFLGDPVRWLRTITAFRGTTSGGPNLAYDICARRITERQKEGLDLSSWNRAFNGAEPVRADTLERFWLAFRDYGFRKEAIYPCYGMAEATLFISGGPADREPVLFSGDSKAPMPEQDLGAQEGLRTRRSLVSCGRTWAETGQQVKIVDPKSLNPLADGKIGEIFLSGPHIALGYWSSRQGADNPFQTRLADGSTETYFRTGDLGFVNSGELVVTGRIKDLIITAGRNVYPEDIEETVEGCHELIVTGSTAAFSMPGDSGEQLVVVAEVGRGDRQRPESETLARDHKSDVMFAGVCSQIAKTVAEQHDLSPHAITLIRRGSIPRTTSGKVQRHVCRDRYIVDGLADLHQWHSKESLERVDKVSLTAKDISAWIVSRMAEKLGIDRETIDLDQPYVDYILDSLTLIEFTGELATWLSVDIPVSMLWEHPTIASVAEALAEELKSPDTGKTKA